MAENLRNMNWIFRIIFAEICFSVFVFCEKCSSELHQAFKANMDLNQSCHDNCISFLSKLVFEGKTWTGFCFRNRFVFFQESPCLVEDIKNLNVTHIIVTPDSCEVFVGRSNNSLDVSCLEKFNFERCEKNTSERNCQTSKGILSGGKDKSFTNTVERILENRNPNSDSREPGKAPTTIITKTSNFRFKRDKKNIQNAVDAQGLYDNFSRFCKANDNFLSDHCYFMHKIQYIQNAQSNSFIEEISDLAVKSCQTKNAEGLPVAVETDLEREFLRDYLEKFDTLIDQIIITSGFKRKGFPGVWRNWNTFVDESIINCNSSCIEDEAALYVINLYTSKWSLINTTSLITLNEENMLSVLCESPYNPKRIRRDLYQDCLEEYQDSGCYNMFKPINYCCAFDEKGLLWFGCPNKLVKRIYGSGTQCFWKCGRDGVFEEEYPSCMNPVACEAEYNGIVYSARLETHAVGACPSNFYGYSTWFCDENGYFVGDPDFKKCCPTDNICKNVDSNLNVWVSCSLKKELKLVQCPPESTIYQAHAEWYCKENGMFEGSAPDYSDCNKVNYGCIRRDKYGRVWIAAAGQVSRKSCPLTSKGECTWKCGYFGEFITSEPDCSTCQVGWINSIADKIKNGTHYKEVMVAMENHTRVEDLTVGYSHILELTSGCVGLYKKQHSYNITAFHDFLIDYSKILTNVAGKPKVWLTFQEVARREYAESILKITQNASFSFLAAEKRNNLEEEFTASLADINRDGFDFYILYNSSLSGAKFPPDSRENRTWQLEVKEVGANSSNYAAMALIMNYSLSNLMFPLGNNVSDKKMNSPAITLTVATSKVGRTIVLPDVLVSVSFKHLNKTRLPETEVIKRKLHQGEYPSGVFKSTSCYYFGETGWNSEGCAVTYTSKEQTNCTCRHLSTIGLLMSIHKYEPDYVMESVSFVSSSITIAALILTLLIFFAFDSIKNDRILIGTNLCCCLLLGHVLLITVMDKRFIYFSDEVCTISAIFIHFVFMAAFSWMFIEGFHLYRMLVLVFESNIEYRFIYLLIGYGMPVVVVGVTEMIGILSREQPYGEDELCWLKTPNYVWAFVGPVIVLTSINFIILILAIKLAVASKMRTEKTNFCNVRTWIKGCFSLSALLGVTWLFGLAYINYNSLTIIQYSFVLLNGLQGFFIFLFRCVFNAQYRTAFMKKLRSIFPNQCAGCENLESGKWGSKIFGINPSKLKLCERTSSTSQSILSQERVYYRKSFLQRLLKFSKSKKKKPEKEGVGDESSSGIGLDYDRNSSKIESTQNELGKELEEEQQCQRIWWTDTDDFPELSYHTNYK